MHHKANAEIDMKNHSFKREKVVLLDLTQKMREQMDLAWRDFFQKNPDKKQEDVLRRLEERLRSEQKNKSREMRTRKHMP